MSELTDDQLDGLFRKSAEEFEPPFDPAAWQDMKTRLDTHDRPTPGGGTPLWKSLLRWGLPICLLLLLTVGGLYMYRRDSPTRKIVTTKPVNANTGTQPEVAKTATQQSATAKQPLTDIDSAPITSTGSSAESVDLAKQSTRLTKPVSEQPAIASTPAKLINQANRSVAGAGETNTPINAGETNEPKVAYGHKRNAAKTEPVPTDQTSAILMERSITKTHNGTSTSQRTDRAVAKRSSTRKQTQTEWLGSNQTHLTTNDAKGSSPTFRKRSLKKAFDKGQSAVTNSPENKYQPMIGQVEPAGLPDVRELTIRPANWPKPLVFTERAVDVASPIAAEPTAVVPKPPVEKGLSVRLAIAPDLSSIGLRNFARPGTNVGVMLEYRFASRWSVQTGIIQSTKIYKASASDYELNDYYKNGMYTIPQGADGQCKMLDIPINIRYDVLLKPRTDGRAPSRWFVSGGVTSYIIERENYVYKYTGYVHKPIPDYNDNGGSYGFSQLNLSIGYERALTKRLSWQVEPFMKMPLRKVGYLNLNLLSTGAFFSIRYKL